MPLASPTKLSAAASTSLPEPCSSVRAGFASTREFSSLDARRRKPVAVPRRVAVLSRLRQDHHFPRARFPATDEAHYVSAASSTAWQNRGRAPIRSPLAWISSPSFQSRTPRL